MKPILFKPNDEDSRNIETISKFIVATTSAQVIRFALSRCINYLNGQKSTSIPSNEYVEMSIEPIVHINKEEKLQKAKDNMNAFLEQSKEEREQVKENISTLAESIGVTEKHSLNEEDMITKNWEGVDYIPEV